MDQLKPCEACGYPPFNSQSYADAIDRLATADALIDQMVRALHSLRVSSLHLYEINWLADVQAYRARVAGGEEQ